MARRLGVGEDQLSGVAAGRFDTFEPAWAAALRFADEMTRGGGRTSEPAVEDLREHFTAEQIVEITAVAALFNYFNRFANSLNIPVTR